MNTGCVWVASNPNMDPVMKDVRILGKPLQYVSISLPFAGKPGWRYKQSTTTSSTSVVAQQVNVGQNELLPDKLVGKRVYHRTLKGYATVLECNEKYIRLSFESGPKAGEVNDYSLKHCLDNKLLEI